MKKIFLLLIISILFSAFANAKDVQVPQASQEKNKMTKIQCTGDVAGKNKSNKIAGDIYVFGINNDKLYSSDGKMIKNAVFKDDTIRATIRIRNGLTLETTRFIIDRNTGGFNYYQTFNTLESHYSKKNTGICKVIKNDKLF